MADEPSIRVAMVHLDNALAALQEDGPAVTLASAQIIDAYDALLAIESSTPNGGEHCAPFGGPHNTCFRYQDGSCLPCGFGMPPGLVS